MILFLQREYGISIDNIEKLLYRQGGLLGVSGISNDMRELLSSRDTRADEALDLFVYRIGRELGAMVAALGGLDGLVFTAGIGEHAPEIRRRVREKASWLGLALDPTANERGAGRISTAKSRISVWVIPANEERTIVRQTIKVLKTQAGNRCSSH